MFMLFVYFDRPGGFSYKLNVFLYDSIQNINFRYKVLFRSKIINILVLMKLKQKNNKEGEYSQLDLWGTPQPQKWEKFEKTREYARSLELTDEGEWQRLVRKRGAIKSGIPFHPDQVYRHSGWKNWNDWLGIVEKHESSSIISDNEESPGTFTLWDIQEKSPWLPFDRARKVSRELGFEYEEEWKIYIEGKFPGREPLPDSIPQNPDYVYRFDGWKGWKDWLITQEKRIEYTNFFKARDFARSLKMKGYMKWREFLIQNTDLLNEFEMILPDRPHLEYKDKGWVSWEDWLGIGIRYHDFKTTRKFVHTLKLRDKNDWRKFCSGQMTYKQVRSENIYAYPEIAFKNEGWNGWDDWLGSDPVRDEKSFKGIPDGALECRCKGRIEDCTNCDGKGYYFLK